MDAKYDIQRKENGKMRKKQLLLTLFLFLLLMLVKTIPSSAEEVQQEQKTSFSYKLPKNVILNSNGIGKYSVSVKGNLTIAQEISITPESSSFLTEKGTMDKKSAVAMNITQKKTKWEKEDISTTKYSESIGEISAPELTAGEWSGSVNFSIHLSDFFCIPTLKTNLVYNGKKQNLIEPGTIKNGTFLYAIGTSETEEPTKWATDIPTATDAGGYPIWVKVIIDEPQKQKVFCLGLAKVESSQKISLNVKNGEAVYSGTSTDGGAEVSGIKETPAIFYGTKNGTYNLSSIPTYTDAGTYTVYYKASLKNYIDTTGSFTITIKKANADFSSRPSVKKLIYNNSSQPLVNIGFSQDGQIYYGSGNSSSVEPTNWNLSVPSGIGVGNYYIWVKIIGDKNHNNLTATYLGTSTIGEGTIQYSASSYGGSYDGKPHSANLTVSTPGCTILYGTSAGNYNLTNMPSYSAAGSYIIYFQITKAGYKTVNGSVNVVLRKSSSLSITEKGANFDVMAGSIKTTYGNSGYRTQIDVNGSKSSMSGLTTTLNNVTFTRNTHINVAGQVETTYTVTNNNSSSATIGISVDTDIQIGSNDSAPVYSTNTGFYMTDGTNYFDLFLCNYAGVTSVDGYHFCQYSNRTNYSWTSGYQSGSLTGTDSGMAFCWYPRTIGANQTQTYTFILDIR